MIPGLSQMMPEGGEQVKRKHRVYLLSFFLQGVDRLLFCLFVFCRHKLGVAKTDKAIHDDYGFHDGSR